MSESDANSVTRLFDSATLFERPTHRLKIETGHPLIETFVINGALDLVAHGQDSLVAELPEGTYQVKFRAGNATTEQWVNLTEDTEVIPSSIPVPHSSFPTEDAWSEQEREAAENFVVSHNLAVVIRDPEHEITPSDQVGIRSISGEVYVQTRNADSNKPGWVTLGNAPILGLGGRADPGAYLLRVSTPEIGTYEMTLWVSPCFNTRVYLTRKFASSWKKRRRTPHLGSATIHLVANDAASPENRRRSELTEIINAALKNDRLLQLNDDILNQAINDKEQYPMLALLAAHMRHAQIEHQIGLAGENKQNTEINQLRDKMASVIENLDKLLPQCPDVGILGLIYGVELSGIDYGIPPMLVQSWNLIAKAENGQLVPKGSYAARIAPALTAERPWLIWRTNQLLPLKLATEASVEMAALLDMQAQIKKTGVTMPNILAQQIIDSPLDQFQSFQELANVLGVPASSVETSIAQICDVQIKHQ